MVLPNQAVTSRVIDEPIRVHEKGKVDKPVARPTSIAVITSGGDAAGMNAALRSVVRTALTADSRCTRSPRATGAGRGRRRDPPAGVARRRRHPAARRHRDRHGPLPDFRPARAGAGPRANLIHRGIDALVVIGGDGSLTGANLFREEWPELLAELVAEGVPSTQHWRIRMLRLVGLVGSIDNDMSAPT